MEHLAQPEVIPVWPGSAPGTHNWSQPEQETILLHLLHLKNTKVVRNVVQPTLTAYLPDPAVANGTAVIVCPGGGFLFLNMDTEGTDVARWLNAHGVTAFVLKYRLLPTEARDEDFFQQLQHPDVEQMKSHAALGVIDGKQALRVIRERAKAWGINPERIGILGFSAGGVVTIRAATQFGAESRPNFAAPIYGPVWQELVVPADAPPLFIALANDDPGLPDDSTSLYRAWKAAGRPVELHIYSKGGHGFAMAPQGLPCDYWIEQFGEWLQTQGFFG